MFDLIGITSPPGRMMPALAERLLASEQWRGSPTSVAGKTVRARFLARTPDLASYDCLDGLHLFVVGEAFAGRRWPTRVDRPIGPLSARQIIHLEPLKLLPCQGAPGFLDTLKGNYTLVLVDEAAGECHICNSRFGISPFYYAEYQGSLWFSTSLAAIAKALPEMPSVDTAAVAELALFNYPLGDRTYLRAIKMLRPAEVVTRTAAGELTRRVWWDARTLYDTPLLQTDEALERGSELFCAAVNAMAADVPRVRVSFTSGFDSRAILSVLRKDRSDAVGYAFGVPGSLNVSIPATISGQLGMPFHAISLDADYARVFDDYAMRAVTLSDCLATVERANYPYAFEQLAEVSPVVLTGLFGSELLRTFQNIGYIVSGALVQIALASNPRERLVRLADAQVDWRYVASALVTSTLEEVRQDVLDVLVEPFGNLSPDKRFYSFLMTEGLRKYFGAEIHMERPWGTNRFPFLDEDFVEFVFQSPFAGVHTHATRPGVADRFASQYFYAHVIARYRPELLGFTTDHGYPPADLLTAHPLVHIVPKFLFGKLKLKLGYHEFRTEEWTESLYRRRLFNRPSRGDLFSPELQTDFDAGAWKATRLQFAKAASFKLWLENIGAN